MTAFFTWYIFLTLLGWLAFPLTYFLFPKLSDRGYTLARTAGLLIWGYAFWLLASFGMAQNDLGGILFALAILIALSVYALITNYQLLIEFIKENKSLIITTEILFLIAFAFLAFLRAANSELQSTEKPMELMFINSILRSETFPPQDVWLSGYAISYYYFGYVMTAMLAQISNVNGSTAHNLMTSLIFALGAIGSFGILYNLLTHHASRITQSIRNSYSVIRNSLLAPVFLLLMSNFETLLEVLHRAGIFWTKDSNGAWASNFWTWLDMKELSQPPSEPLGLIPDRYLWWWRASRVIQDYDIAGGFREVIDEFPFFSFLLGDLHPHVLAIPFSLLAISVALNIFLGGWRGKIEFFGVQLYLNPIGFFFSALVLGGLAFLNTWDILVGATLICSAYIFSRVDSDGWSWKRLEDLFILALPLGAVSLILYFPFYLGFSSQAGGLLPNFMYPTRGTHLWVMWGTLLIPIFSYLIYLSSRIKKSNYQVENETEITQSDTITPNWKLGLYLGIGFTLFLFALTFLIGWIGSIVERDFVNFQLASFNMTVSQFIGATSLRRLTHIGSLITLLAVFIPTLSFLFNKSPIYNSPNPQLPITNYASRITHHASRFTLLLLTLGTILILAPEFVYLRDQFGYRINTVFKFYYQAWILWSIVSAFAVAILLQNLQKVWATGFRIVIGFVIFCGLLYPTFGVMTKTNNFKPPFGYTLNDFDRVKRENPEEAAAIEFLLTQPKGIIAEAIGGGYSAYGRISMYTGFQTVLGWTGHEAQWRGSYEPQGTRFDDINRLYTTANWEEARDIIERYNIRYIYIGSLERTSMPVNEEKFYLYLTPIFQQGNTVIFEVP
jgi:YYY domain-containing protein